MADEDGAAAAAPVPAPANRPIVIQRHKKAKGAPPPTFEDVRDAAGVGDPHAQLPADAPGAKLAYERAEDISRALGTHALWTADAAASRAVRNYQRPLTEGGEPIFPIPPPP